MFKRQYFFTLSSTAFIYLYALFTLLFFNSTFFAKLYEADSGILFITAGTVISYVILALAVNILFFCRRAAKIIGITLVILNSLALAFMHTYNILIDKVMILNVIRTDIYEAGDLFQWKLVFIIALLGLLPAYLIHKTNIIFQSGKAELTTRIKHIAALLAAAAICILPAPKTFKQTLKNHYELRYAFVPSNYLSAFVGIAKMHKQLTRPFTPIAADAQVNKYWKNDKKNLFVFVVGETARAANFSLGGYERQTNEPLTPYLKELVYYPQFYACGTSTAVAVPCIFSKDGRKEFKTGSELNSGNLADVMQNSGYHALWRDNNTGCQDNCNRIELEMSCPGKGCADDILLKNLEKKIKSINRNTFLILHQKGSHGPDYFNRYPSDWQAPYQPVCTDAGLKSCNRQELVNTYDNSIYYTGIFLKDLFNELKKFEKDYNIVVIYASDHGESLGEDGHYLHAYPYDSAPDEQKHIPAIVWMPPSTAKALGINMKCLKKNAKKYHSHDNLFHSFLGLAGISTQDYKPELDIFRPCQKP